MNIILYGLFLLGYIRTKQPKPLLDRKSASEAFGFLERSYKFTFPEARDGFTWAELISRAKNTDLGAADVNWKKVQRAVKEYEASRYGNKPEPGDFDAGEILRLSFLLQKTRSSTFRKILKENSN